MSASEVQASPSAHLSRFAASSTPASVPAPMRAIAAAAIAELCRAAAEGWREPDVAALADTVLPLQSVSEASVVATGALIGASSAAELNAASAQAAPGTRSVSRQVADVVAAATLAAAEAARIDGEEILLAVAVGLEVAARAAHALGESHLERGWRLPGSAGRLGAAIGASRAFRLDAAEHLVAFAFAATQVAGFSTNAGVTVPLLVAARAAHDALESAVVAAAGLVGDPLPLEGRRGLLALASDDAVPERLDEHLGSAWRALEAGFDAAPPDDALGRAALALGSGGTLAALLAAARPPA